MYMYARIVEINIFLFYFSFIFFFIKRKVSEEMPLTSEDWGRNAITSERMVITSEEIGITSEVIRINGEVILTEKQLKNTLKSGIFEVVKIMCFSCFSS